MSRQELNLTSFDYDAIKQDLIAFLASTGKFDDFDFEGSTLNTIIDLLVRNTHFTGFMASMLANESFIASAQIRNNVVSHAQKLSYTPKSTTASRIVCNIQVIPVETSGIPSTITLQKGTPFLANQGGQTFSFTNTETYVLYYDLASSSYKRSGVQLYQGTLVNNKVIHVTNAPAEIVNKRVDTSTLSVTASKDSDTHVFNEATTFNELSKDSYVYFLSENVNNRFQVEFGRDILGVEPDNNTIVNFEYIVCEEDHAIGVDELIIASLVSGYSNITVTVTEPSQGGSERDGIETIRYMAPKMYQAQDRALTSNDYIPILRSRFPFIQSAIAWGGETNNPPQYGTVFISILSDQGKVTNSIKQQMVTYLTSKNVGSITPTIVDAVLFDTYLTVNFSYDTRLVSKTYNQITSEISNIIDAYNDTIFKFDEFLNTSELVYQIKKSVRGITSVDIEYKIGSTVDVLLFDDPIYYIDFGNPLVEGGLSIEDDILVQLSVDGINMYDEGGIIYISYTDAASITKVKEVGTINYETGEVEFVLNIQSNITEFEIKVTPVEENFYTAQNRVISIKETDYNLIDIKNRTTFNILDR